MVNEINFRGFSGNVEIPLYKYYSNLEYAEGAITNKRIHLESPNSYNDIYDSSFYLTEDFLKKCCNTPHNICEILKQTLPSKYAKALIKCQNSISSDKFSVYEAIEYICSNTKFAKEEVISECIERVTKGNIFHAYNNKVSCFSEKYDSLLMWAYYANSYTGVCLGFDIMSDPILSKHCHKVQYTGTYIADGKEYSNYFRKSEQWSHEQEWRIVCDSNDDYLKTNSLRAIILGYKITEENRKRFLNLAVDNQLDLYIIKPSNKKYQLIAQPILIHSEKELLY